MKPFNKAIIVYEEGVVNSFLIKNFLKCCGYLISDDLDYVESKDWDIIVTSSTKYKNILEYLKEIKNKVIFLISDKDLKDTESIDVFDSVIKTIKGNEPYEDLLEQLFLYQAII